jgi:hypothetical protein
MKRRLGKVLLLALLVALGFALPYLWTLLTSDSPASRDPKTEDYAKD